MVILSLGYRSTMGKNVKKKYTAKNGLIGGSALVRTVVNEKKGFGPEVVAIDEDEARSVEEIVHKLHGVSGSIEENREELQKWAKPTAFFRYKVHTVGRIYKWIRAVLLMFFFDLIFLS